jgi:hypothetical protein
MHFLGGRIGERKVAKGGLAADVCRRIVFFVDTRSPMFFVHTVFTCIGIALTPLFLNEIVPFSVKGRQISK